MSHILTKLMSHFFTKCSTSFSRISSLCLWARLTPTRRFLEFTNSMKPFPVYWQQWGSNACFNHCWTWCMCALIVVSQKYEMVNVIRVHWSIHEVKIKYGATFWKVNLQYQLPWQQLVATWCYYGQISSRHWVFPWQYIVHMQSYGEWHDNNNWGKHEQAPQWWDVHHICKDSHALLIQPTIFLQLLSYLTIVTHAFS